MAKKKKKNSKKKIPKPRRASRVRKPTDPAVLARRRKMAKVVLGVIAVVGVIAILWLLADSIRRNIPPVTEVVLADPPEWLDEEASQEIRRTVLELARKDSTDPKLPAKAAVALSGSIWIERIPPAAIVNDRQGRLIINCEYRKPLAMVTGPTVLVRVSADGLVLPGKYKRTAPEAKLYRRILGVTTEAPEAGVKWKAADFQAGVALLKLIDGRPVGSEITAVDVSNYKGRKNPTKAHLVLMSEEAYLYWGRAIGTEGRLEADHLSKLKNLEVLFLELGSLNKLNYANLTGEKATFRRRGKLNTESQ